MACPFRTFARGVVYSFQFVSFVVTFTVRKYLLTSVVLLLTGLGGLSVLKAQSFSFNCARDTLLPGCPQTLCFTLTTKLPNPSRQAPTYVVNPTGQLPSCLLASSNPGIPGQPTSLNVDDRYSPAFPIGFPFIFFGTAYSNLVVSSNGYLSFDVARANMSSHWNIINGGAPQDLPSTFYDRALIMGPYHDIDVGVTTSPTRLISYQTDGLAPYRRWILNYFKIPLFSSTCNNLINNTHQIILYESTGIIDVNIFDKQICNSWNQGRAMVGLQNFDRNSGVMAPGRRASDPPWGSVGMNESWRFVPSGGTPLFRSVSLYDITGTTLIATGTTTVLPNGDREASFPNLCPPAGTVTRYVIKALYDKIDDPTVEIMATDTINVSRLNGLAASVASQAAACGVPTGTVTVSNVNGGTPPYTFSIDGVNFQPNATFTALGAGTYTVTVKDASGQCTYATSVTVASAGSLTAAVTAAPTACTGVSNGTVTITSASGAGPHRFQLDGGTPVVGTIPFTFTNVAAGNHTVIVTDQATNCSSGSLPVTVTQGLGVTATTTANATSCPTVNNGSATVTVNAGTPPFRYAIDGGTPTAPTPAATYTFNGLSSGSHSVVVTDALGCSRTLNVFVVAGPTLLAGAAPTATTCEGAANGNLVITPFSGTAPYTFSLDGAGFVSGAAPYTFNNVAAGPHTILVRDAQGCQSNAVPVTVAAGPPLVTTATSTPALCNAGSSGTITVAPPAIGLTPFEYSLDGISWQTTNQFTGLAAGTYTVRFREANGCIGSTSLDIAEPVAINLSATTVPVVCNGQSNGQLTVAATGGVAPYQFSVNGGTTWQTSTGFSLSAGNYTLTIKDANNCTRTLPVVLTEPPALGGTLTTTNASCNGGNDGTITLTPVGGNGTYSYSLDGGINWQTANNFNLAPGTYTVTIKDQLNCTYDIPAVVGLTNDLTVTPQTDVSICESKSTQLQVVSNALQYDWTPASGLSAVNISNPVASPRVTTQYIVALTLGRCIARDTVLVTVNPAPIPNAGPDIFICYGQSATLNGSGGTVYRWSPSTYLNNPALPNAVSTPDRNIYYVLSVLSDANGCAALVTDTVMIDVTPPIQVKTYPADTIGYPGDQFQLLAVPNDPDVTTYVWTPSVGLSNAGVASPTVTIGAIGSDVRYKVVASTVAGCKGEAYVNVRVYKGPDIYVPTGFTPNGDGKNDKFTPFPVGMKSYNYFRIFNRWGQLVFQTRRLNDGWDGTIGGQLQPEGIYVWMIEGLTKDDRVITKKGTIMLIK
jgi:gliding motility-associated-like protein